MSPMHRRRPSAGCGRPLRRRRSLWRRRRRLAGTPPAPLPRLLQSLLQLAQAPLPRANRKGVTEVDLEHLPQGPPAEQPQPFIGTSSELRPEYQGQQLPPLQEHGALPPPQDPGQQPLGS